MTNSLDRIRHLKNGVFNGNSVLYWMVRDKRVSDNWALLEAQKIALKNNIHSAINSPTFSVSLEVLQKHVSYLCVLMEILQM